MILMSLKWTKTILFLQKEEMYKEINTTNKYTDRDIRNTNETQISNRAPVTE